ncbi:hypothetical protein MVEN_01602000 [Mycena venus]|uniref:Uncharacterized protein n=1 Tax=Mycena venus TaxID=2733690 RepID=A0A8H6XS90_9AGAR|nr:hypothetical protein MVEN_01602000 [Mycena venus]
MHRSLRLENLALLPISVQRFAIPASNGSVSDFDRLIELLDDERHTLCLPVFYANLDPAGIPTEENLTTDTVICALMALDELHDLNDSHKAAWADLWPRIYAWTIFFHAYREYLVEPFARPDVCLALVAFVALFNRDEDLKTMIGQTVGLRTLLITAWIVIMESGQQQDHWAFRDLCCVLCDIRIDGLGDFEEIIEVAGIKGLACLVNDTISFFLFGGQSHMTEDDVVFLGNILLFLGNLRNTKTMSRALVAAGGATTITAAAITWLTRNPPSDAPTTVAIVLGCLNILSGMVSGHRAMRDSVATGLPSCIMFCLVISLDRDAHGVLGLKQILKQTLPASTIYQTVLPEIELQLQYLRRPGENRHVQSSWIYPDWISFTTLADERIAFMKKSNQRITFFSRHAIIWSAV